MLADKRDYFDRFLVIIFSEERGGRVRRKGGGWQERWDKGSEARLGGWRMRKKAIPKRSMGVRGGP